MNITENEYYIKRIIDVYKGETAIKHLSMSCRENDGLIYLISGSAVYRCFNKEFCANAGDVFYLSKNSNYEISVNEFPFTYICINFLFENESDTPFDCDVFKSKNPKFFEAHFLKAKTLWKSLSVPERILCKAVLLEIYADIVKNQLQTYLPYSKIQKMQKIVSETEKNIPTPT